MEGNVSRGDYMNNGIRMVMSVFAVMVILCVPVIASTGQSVDAIGDEGDRIDINCLITQYLNDTAEDFNLTIGKEYGINYDDYVLIMSVIMGSSISITSENGIVNVEFAEQSRSGSFGAELHGHDLYIYLDSVSVSMIMSGGAAAIGAAIGAAVGSVVPALGTVLGGAAGAIILAAIEGGLTTAIMEGLDWQDGIVAIVKIMDSYSIFGFTFDFFCSPSLVDIRPQ